MTEMGPPPVRPGSDPLARPPALALGATGGVGALATTAGAIVLAGDNLDLSPSTIARLPGGSSFSAALVLGLVVVLPLVVTMVAGFRGSDRTGELCVLAGAALIGAVVAHLEVVREFSWLQPAGLLYGATMVVLGLMRSRPPPDSVDGPPRPSRPAGVPMDPAAQDLGHSNRPIPSLDAGGRTARHEESPC